MPTQSCVAEPVIPGSERYFVYRGDREELQEDGQRRWVAGPGTPQFETDRKRCARLRKKAVLTVGLARGRRAGRRAGKKIAQGEFASFVTKTRSEGLGNSGGISCVLQWGHFCTPQYTLACDPAVRLTIFPARRETSRRKFLSNIDRLADAIIDDLHQEVIFITFQWGKAPRHGEIIYATAEEKAEQEATHPRARKAAASRRKKSAAAKERSKTKTRTGAQGG